MKLLNAVRPALSLALAVTVICTCRVADGQYPGGTGTTGATDGSGRGTGSAGVQTGGGPDTSQSSNANQPFNIFGRRQDVTTTTTANTSATTNTGSERSKKQTRKVHKKSSKTSKQSQATTSPSASASPR